MQFFLLENQPLSNTGSVAVAPDEHMRFDLLSLLK